ncbi:MAG TPA: hypothetical protein VKU00_08410 [Chthonomonadaceae bacterium]|nr:hypothetical protein [Chthonomonadaceae bacterium]
MGKHLPQQEEETAVTYHPVEPVGQEIVQAEHTQKRQEVQEVEDIRTILSFAVEKPRSLPTVASVPLAGVALISLYHLYTILQLFATDSLRVPYIIQWLLSLLMQLLVPGSILWYINSTQADLQADLEIGEPDVRWTGDLIEMLKDPNRRIHNAARRLLARTLPRLRASDAALLDPMHWRTLYNRLLKNAPADADLNAAILRLVATLGHMEALPYVERLAETGTLLPRKRYVQRIACICLTELERRFNKHQVPAIAQHSIPQPDLDVSQTALQDAEIQEEAEALPSDVVTLTEELKLQSRKSGQPAMRLGFLVASWCTIVPLTGWQAVKSAMEGRWLEALGWGVGMGIGTQLYRFALSSRRSELAQKLAAYDHIEGVGPLAEALEWPDAATQAVAKVALTRLLPKLRASDARLLNAHQRGCLHRMLKMSNAVRDRDLLLAILKALQQVGDAMSVPYVQRLANSITLIPSQKQIRQVAEECLPWLTDRAAQKRASDTLLRAAASDPEDTAVLLRPVGHSPTEPQQLLRAGVANETQP